MQEQRHKQLVNALFRAARDDSRRTREWLLHVKQYVHPTIKYSLLHNNCAHYVHAITAPFGVNCTTTGRITLPSCACDSVADEASDPGSCAKDSAALERFARAGEQYMSIGDIRALLGNASVPFKLHVIRFERPPHLHVALLLEFDADEGPKFASWGAWPELTLTNATMVWRALDADSQTLATRVLLGATAGVAAGLAGAGLFAATALGGVLGAAQHMRKGSTGSVPEAIASHASQPNFSVCFPDVVVSRFHARPGKWAGLNLLRRERARVDATISDSAEASIDAETLSMQTLMLHGLIVQKLPLKQTMTLREWLGAQLEAVETASELRTGLGVAPSPPPPGQDRS